MSRIGKLPITIPAKVEVKVSGNMVHVKGPKGELKQKLEDGVSVKVDGTTLHVERATEQKRHRALHGLYRALINNMIIGVPPRLRLGWSIPRRDPTESRPCPTSTHSCPAHLYALPASSAVRWMA